MSELHKTRKVFAIWLIVGLLTAAWASQTHAHTGEENFDVDLVCSACLVGEKLSHFDVTAEFTHSLNAVVTEQPTYLYYNNSPLIPSHYLSRAPPFNL